MKNSFILIVTKFCIADGLCYRCSNKNYWPLCWQQEILFVVFIIFLLIKNYKKEKESLMVLFFRKINNLLLSCAQFRIQPSTMRPNTVR